MIHRKSILTYISSIAINVFMLAVCTTVSAQGKTNADKEGEVALFKGFAVSVDLVGPVQMMISDYGQYEAALRLNLRNKYFPIVEVGLGKADYTDDATDISYKTSAPYARIGIDFNLLKDKKDIYRLYAGARYAYTTFEYDINHPGIKDPVWGTDAEFRADDVKCDYHWLEALIGVDAKIWGPVHMGWSLRYRSRLSSKEGEIGNAWYVPGYGKGGGSVIGGTFNVSVDI